MITSTDLNEMGYAHINAFFDQMISKRQSGEFDQFISDVHALSKKQKKAFVDYCDDLEGTDSYYGDYAAAVVSAQNIVYNSI